MANILVVDDEMGIRELLSEILGDEGHVVTTAENAQQARDFFRGCVPDLILLDIWMPDTDGITLLKEWKRDGALTMPVIMMSGHATIDTAMETTHIGAKEFLEKPIAMQRLVKTVQKWLSGSNTKPVQSSLGAYFNTSHLSISTRSSLIGVPRSDNTLTTYINVRTNTSSPDSPRHLPVAPAIYTPYGISKGHNVAMQLPLPPNLQTLSDAVTQQSPDLVSTIPPVEALFAFSFGMPLREARDMFERSYFEYHLMREGGSMTRVADKTGLERTHLYRKLKQLGVESGKGGRKNHCKEEK